MLHFSVQKKKEKEFSNCKYPKMLFSLSLDVTSFTQQNHLPPTTKKKSLLCKRGMRSGNAMFKTRVNEWNFCVFRTLQPFDLLLLANHSFGNLIFIIIIIIVLNNSHLCHYHHTQTHTHKLIFVTNSNWCVFFVGEAKIHSQFSSSSLRLHISKHAGVASNKKKIRRGCEKYGKKCE